jgi:mRNA interferase HigB
MRVIKVSTLKEFWQEYPDSEQDLKYWYERIRKYSFNNPSDIISEFPSADIIGNNRVVFNICHNRYRLIVVIRYKIQIVFIRFIGTHKEYDKLDNIKNI